MASRNKGLSLVEVVIASAIILGAVVALLAVHSLYLRVSLSNGNAIKAGLLAEEGLEAMRWLRNKSWSSNIGSLSVGTNYGLVLSGSSWQTSVADTYVDNFQRTVNLSLVYRDANGDIVATGGTLDTGTILIASTVSWWNGRATSTKAISTYLADIYGN